MSMTLVESTTEMPVRERIAELGQRVLNGGEISRIEAIELARIEDNADIMDLLAWANRIREHFKGNNSSLLNRQRQSWCLLGELLLLCPICVLPDRVAAIRFCRSRAG
jgi:hypothetical protein